MDKQTNKDHRQIGQELELFFTNDIAPGAPFWLPKGMIIFKELEKYIRELTLKAGYQETSTPIMVKSGLFEKSGHWTKFGAHNMYNLSLWEDQELEELKTIIGRSENKIKKYVEEQLKNDPKSPFPFYFKIGDYHGVSIEVQILNYDPIKGVMWTPPVNYSLKPMNCPESTLIYSFKSRSYKELPLRLSEIGKLHRREKAGEVNGLLRVRQLTMDDAHIYATEDQIFNEVSNILDTMINFYKMFGFEYDFRLATRPESRAGSDTNWSKAEKALADALKKKGIKAGNKMGDGAFYGPKIDVHIKDSLGRDWQLATVQLDFHQPEAFKLTYIDKDGKEKRPVMIHRAIFGSFERFIAILTEHYQGAFPLWLSPVQIVIMPITDKQESHAKKIVEELRENGIRVELDNRPERLQAKIRDATLQKVPYIGIIGDRELESGKLKVENGKISIRTREGKDLGQIKLSQFLNKLKEEIDKKI